MRSLCGPPKRRSAGIRIYVNNDTSRGAHRRPHNTPSLVRSPEDWKPEPCLLTREQVRQIILEQIG